LMARGLRKHLKRLSAPRHWMLSKMGGVFAPRPSSGPHKLRESLPLTILVRNRLKYALNGREVNAILHQRHVQIDGKVRTNNTYPAGFMDVVTLKQTGENFRLLYDVKGRFLVQKISPAEAKFKLCKIKKVWIGAKGVPYINTHDGRTLRYADPLIRVNDTIKLDLETNKITEYVKFEAGNLAMITGGRNTGRVGVIVRKEKHPGSFDIVEVKDAANQTFSTRAVNVFVIGKGTKSIVSLPRAKGVKKSIVEELNHRLQKSNPHAAPIAPPTNVK